MIWLLSTTFNQKKSLRIDFSYLHWTSKCVRMTKLVETKNFVQFEWSSQVIEISIIIVWRTTIMCKISPVVRQFLAILSCESFQCSTFITKTRFIHCRNSIFVGNLLSFSLGFCSFWGTINLIELKSPNSTYPVIITDDQSSVYMSIGNIGGLVGIFVILPIGQHLGVKNAIHLLSVPMIVSISIYYFKLEFWKCLLKMF